MVRCLQSHLKFREAAFFMLKYRFFYEIRNFDAKITYFTIENGAFSVNKNVKTL